MKAWLLMACLTSTLPSLQPLLDAAEEGSVVIPPPGRYAGPAVIRKKLTLDGRGAVTVDGQGQGTVLTVQAAGATVRSLHLTRSGTLHDAMDSAATLTADRITFADNTIDESLFGVIVKGASQTLVCGNVIHSTDDEPGLRGDGVRVWNGAYNLIFGNEVDKTRDVTLANGHDNAVVGNRIRHGRFGLQLVFAPKSRIEDNWIDGNFTGIAILYSDEVALRRNRVQNSPGVSGVGMAFKESSQAVVEDNAIVHCAVGAKANSPTHPLNVLYFRRNLFAHNVAALDFYGENGGHVLEANRFERNFLNITVSAPMSARANTWSGNAWDDYEGFDRDGDGVGDVPHSVYWFADRIFLEEPKSTFFRGSPVMELIDFLERLAPFASPELILEDPKPDLRAVTTVAFETKSAAFSPSCPKGSSPQ